MFNGNGGYSLADIAAATGDGRNNDGWGGNSSWWIIILFLFMCGGWGNNNRNNGSTVREEVAYGFDINNLDRGIRGTQQGICDGFYAMNTGMLNGFAQQQSTMCQGFSGIHTAVNNAATNLSTQLHDMSAQQAACCCQTQRENERGFCDLNYNLATQSCDTRRAICDSTRDIIDNQNNNTRSIIDFLTQDKIATLTAENQNLRFAASQCAQNTYLINELKQCPIPAYVVPNPYCGCGTYANCCVPQQNMCGCNNNCCC